MPNKTNHVFVIAEAGVNHNGSLSRALKMAEVAASAGADAVKFQTFKAKNLVTRNAAKAEYQKRNTDASESQISMLKKLELSASDHQALISCCESLGIEFMSSPFDHESLDLLANRFDLARLKLGSGELTNAPLLLDIGRRNKPLILSTGMSTLEEVREALAVLAFGYLDKNGDPDRKKRLAILSSAEGRNILKKKVILLHCTTEYPTPFADVNLRAMKTLSEIFGLDIGYSDHTKGWSITLAAVARGACVIEKHFTLDRSLPGPDHEASLEPKELLSMVSEIRQIEQALGTGLKKPVSSEVENISIARKSLVAAKKINKGDVFSEKNLIIKRPGNGVSPFEYWSYLGQPSKQDYAEDELIKP